MQQVKSWGLGFGVEGLGLGVWGLGFKAEGLEVGGWCGKSMELRKGLGFRAFRIRV